MPEYASALICLSIVIVAILITEIVKFIMKKVAAKNGKTFDCKKWEYLFAAISILISGVGVVCFLKFEHLRWKRTDGLFVYRSACPKRGSWNLQRV